MSDGTNPPEQSSPIEPEPPAEQPLADPTPEAPSAAATGGIARARKLNSERRSDIARAAALSRWGKTKGEEVVILRATHIGEIRLGDAAIDCAVLEDGQRVLSARGVERAVGRKRGGWSFKRARERAESGGAVLPPLLAAGNLAPFISNDLLLALQTPILYHHSRGGGVAHGVDATVLPQICDVWLRARDAKVLKEGQKPIAAKADILMRGLAHVGIIALVDEATGYQNVRAREALEKILEKFLRKELGEWAKRFPDEFYEHIFRLRGWKYSEIRKVKRPGVVGRWTSDIVYKRLAPRLLEELCELNPSDGHGRRKSCHHQWLTEDIGHLALRQHLISVIALMRAAPDWKAFFALLNRAFPKYNETIQMFPEFGTSLDDTRA